ncbi:MAG: DUF2934 domain-containing protein [Nitrospirota bacterium]|nr:DUF2934 domain-containing protein [Nitrospirota bacterium]
MNRTEQPRRGKPANHSSQTVETQKAAGQKASAPSRTKTARGTTPTVSVEQRHNMIAELAYLLAEQRGFGSGAEQDDWFRAESIVDKRLSGAR